MSHDHHHDDHDHDHDDHDHDDHDGHDHHGHHHAPANFDRAFAIGMALNAAYVAAEAGFGIASNSLALLADAGHNFSDVVALGLAWLAAWLGRLAPSRRYTYGLRGSSILAALGNAGALLLVTGAIAWEAVQRLMKPEHAAGVTIMVVAGAGVVINTITALLFAAGRKGDLNIRGAFLHMASDALIALGVVVTGGAILATGWTWLDPAISLVISGVIVVGTWSLMREALNFALAAVPAAVDSGKVLDYLTALPGVTDVHDLHIWGMSTTETALTAHLVRPGEPVDDALLQTICGELRGRFAIHHATIQVEAGSDAHPCELAPHGVV